jgi:hypothetical protein
MKLPNKVYDVLKWVLGVAVAPAITLIVGLGEAFHFDTYLIVQVITLVASFLGAIFGISVYQYGKGDEDADS